MTPARHRTFILPIVLYGAICEQLKSGKVKDVEIIFGCPNVPIP